MSCCWDMMGALSASPSAALLLLPLPPRTKARLMRSADKRRPLPDPDGCSTPVLKVSGNFKFWNHLGRHEFSFAWYLPNLISVINYRLLFFSEQNLPFWPHLLSWLCGLLCIYGVARLQAKLMAVFLVNVASPLDHVKMTWAISPKFHSYPSIEQK